MFQQTIPKYSSRIKQTEVYSLPPNSLEVDSPELGEQLTLFHEVIQEQGSADQVVLLA